ncbi:MAG: glycosyltransferase family 2 protein, partial [bacterium]|nr:glycosyltransferase family 2 protein [bacterium]
IKEPKKWPRVSFIIPCYNGQETVNETLDSIFKQEYQGAFDVVVYLSGDLDGYQFKHRKGLSILKGQGKVEKALAVNQAAKQVKGDFLFVVDADTCLDKQALRLVILRFNKDKVGAVTTSRLVKENNFWSLLQGFEYVMTNILLTSYNKLGSTVGLHGCSMCFRKQAFNQVGGIKRLPAQDFDVALRLVEKDWQVVCEIKAKAFTLSPKFRKWTSQRFRWMRGFSLAILNHYKVFFAKPFGLFFTVIYGLMSIIYLANFFISQSFFKSISYLFLTALGFNLPLVIVLGILTGFLGWAIYDRLILYVLYASLSLPYILYPYKLRDFLKAPLIFVYSLVYLPLFVLFNIFGIILALNDKIKKRETIKW